MLCFIHKIVSVFMLVSLFIRATDLGFLKPLCSKAQFFVFDPARKIRDTKKNRPPFLQGTLIH
jgi:hypothetical protein